MSQSHTRCAARALAHLGEVDPALAVLGLWCRHRDGDGITMTAGEVITYGPDFTRLALPEQVGLVAHHILHVALRHSARMAGLQERLGDSFDPTLFGLAADGIINDTLILAGHAIPRPAVTLTDLLQQAGIPEPTPIAALERWDADRLAMALHTDPNRAKRLKDWGKSRGFDPDLGAGDPQEDAKPQSAADWRNQMLRAMEAGRKAGQGIGRLGAILADLTPAATPWEVHLRRLLALALIERPQTSWRRPSGAWVARMAEAERHGSPTPVFEPGRQRQSHLPRIVIGLDTSSSIDPQTLRLFAAEAEAITRRTGAEAHVLVFDEKVSRELRPDLDGWTALRTAPLRTGGGTDYHDLFARAGQLRPSILVVLTDLDAPLPARPGFPLVWAVPNDSVTPEYGRVITIGANG